MAERGATLLKWDHWHIEASSICTLRCPRCPRMEVPDSLLNRQLSLDFFRHQIGPEVVASIRKITFCGNDGDPIYCRDLIDICAWIKTVNPDLHLVIITNGSHRSESWWQRLGAVLNHHDELVWSIDGWDQISNAQYRVNCDWSSIIEGLAAFKKSNQITYRVWASIAFRFNQDQLGRMQDLAQGLDMDLFQLTKSTKFGSHYPEIYGSADPLCPDREELVSASHRFERSLIHLTQRPRPGDALHAVFLQRAKDLQQNQQHSGICLIGNKGVFINSQGEFYPCCWTANRYAHNAQWHALARSRFNLWHKKFVDIINDAFWQTDFLKFDSHECRSKCTPEKLKDHEHVTAW